MLISQEHKFIFIHIYKNAGSSITRALIPYCSNPVRLFTHRVLKRIQIRSLDPIPYRKHIKAPELVQRMGYDQYKSYFSFAIVRNPWDWNVSLYKYMLKDKNHFQHELAKSFKNFDEYIQARCKGSFAPQKNFIYSEKGEQLVDYIARFENIEEEFKKICTTIGIRTELPHLNISNKTNYQKFYTEKTRELVRKSYKTDIELFEYEF